MASVLGLVLTIYGLVYLGGGADSNDLADLSKPTGTGSFIGKEVDASSGLTDSLLYKEQVIQQAGAIVETVPANRDFDRLAEIANINFKADGEQRFKHFDDVSYAQLAQLVDEGFVDPEGSDLVELLTIMKFLRDYPRSRAVGYVWSDSAYPVTIQGVRIPSSAITSETARGFIHFVNQHDILSTADLIANERGIEAFWED